MQPAKVPQKEEIHPKQSLYKKGTAGTFKPSSVVPIFPEYVREPESQYEPSEKCCTLPCVIL